MKLQVGKTHLQLEIAAAQHLAQLPIRWEVVLPRGSLNRTPLQTEKQRSKQSLQPLQARVRTQIAEKEHEQLAITIDIFLSL
jgi:hypothetical protein